MRVKVVTAAAWCGLERSRKVHRSTSRVSVPRSRGAARHPERSRSRRTKGLCRLPPSGSRCGSGEPCPGACRRRLACAGRTGAGRSEPGETRRCPPGTRFLSKRKKTCLGEEACHVFKQTDPKPPRQKSALLPVRG